MKIILNTLVCMILLPLANYGQNTGKPTPIYIVKSMSNTKDIITHNLVINPSNLADVKILTKDEALRKIGRVEERAVVMIVTPSPGVKLLTTSEFYKNRNISDTQKQLPLIIDGKRIHDLKDLLIDESSLKFVTVTSDSIVLMTSSHLHSLELKKKKVIQ